MICGLDGLGGYFAGHTSDSQYGTLVGFDALVTVSVAERHYPVAQMLDLMEDAAFRTPSADVLRGTPCFEDYCPF